MRSPSSQTNSDLQNLGGARFELALEAGFQAFPEKLSRLRMPFGNLK
jgi:hypothetical protein